MSLKSSNKAKLGKILENSLANERAGRDLQGIIGIKGNFEMNAAGTAVSDVVGTGFTVVVDSVTAGAFHVYLDKAPSHILGVKGMIFVPKAVGDSSDAVEIDVAGWDVDDDGLFVTFRVVEKAATYDVTAPGDDCRISFEINCTYSDEVGYY